jgi:hypothetical protein
MAFCFTAVSVCSNVMNQNRQDGAANTEQSDNLNINDREIGTMNCSAAFTVCIRAPCVGGRGKFHIHLLRVIVSFLSIEIHEVLLM